MIAYSRTIRVYFYKGLERVFIFVNDYLILDSVFFMRPNKFSILKTIYHRKTTSFLVIVELQLYLYNIFHQKCNIPFFYIPSILNKYYLRLLHTY